MILNRNMNDFNVNAYFVIFLSWLMRLDSSFAPVIHLANIYQAPTIYWTLCSGAKETEKRTKDLCSEGAPGTSLGLSSDVTATDT